MENFIFLSMPRFSKIFSRGSLRFDAQLAMKALKAEREETPITSFPTSSTKKMKMKIAKRAITVEIKRRIGKFLPNFIIEFSGKSEIVHRTG